MLTQLPTHKRFLMQIGQSDVVWTCRKVHKYQQIENLHKNPNPKSSKTAQNRNSKHLKYNWKPQGYTEYFSTLDDTDGKSIKAALGIIKAQYTKGIAETLMKFPDFIKVAPLGFFWDCKMIRLV